MPFTSNGDVRIYWRRDGKPSFPVLVLGNSLGTDMTMWEPVMPRLLRHFQIIRFDMRGHGASDAPQAEYSMADLTDDLAAVIEAANIARFDYCGVSMGGMVGIAYAQRRDPRLSRLVLSNTAVSFPESVWLDRIERVQQGGMTAIADTVLEHFFTADFLKHANIDFERLREALLSQDAHGYAGCCAAIRDMSLSGGLKLIDVPVLVITGRDDASTPPSRGEEIAAAIPDARIAALPGAHIPMVERPLAWNDTILAFLAPTGDMSEAQRYDIGLARRREVLGSAYVDARLAARTSFTKDFQALITQLAWGRLWTSTRLDDLTRRVVVLAMTAAMGKWEEFDLHVAAALRAGVEIPVLQEVLTMVSVYAGVPAANTGFARASKLIAQTDSDTRTSSSL